ncbi:MAG: hypothetical protein M3Q20_00210 [Actinomycetota bacterium]|nr:hypothetical protein [Actinomycetota bacterium]
MSRRRSVQAFALALAVGSALLAACGSPSYEYVRNTEAKTAFKVPHGWTLFDEAAMQGDAQGQLASAPDPVEWLVGFDADPAPAREHVLSLAAGSDTTYPHGIAGVYSLSTEARDNVNLTELRNLIIPIDSIRDQVGSEALNLIAYDDHLEIDGFRGLHFEAQVSISALEFVLGDGAVAGGDGSSVLLSDDYLHINQTAYMDPSTDKVYLMVVVCSADCYERNRADIETVVDSWAVIA